MTKRLETYEQVRFWLKVEKTESCWVWTAAKNTGGYGAVKSDGKSHQAHRLAYEWENGPIPKGICVLHHCDNRSCVNPSHLFLGTIGDNNRDCFAKGRQPPMQGEHGPNHKLTQEQVNIIRAIYSTGTITQRNLGKQFGISKSEICCIVLRQRW